MRTPLPENHILRLKSGEYVIKKKIAEGGFSLVYDAETTNGTAPLVIKEYFPAEGAYRNEQNKVCPRVGYEEAFNRNLLHFCDEGTVGGLMAKFSFQTVTFLCCDDGYAVMKKNSQDLISISDLVERWAECPPEPFSGNKADADPVFTDFARLDYSLHITESALTVLSGIHDNEYLHLDISGRNILWAGSDWSSGRNCFAVFSDFGCCCKLADGVFQPDYQLSYSPSFAAPEVQRGVHLLSPATDIYSVGMLLFYLCVGEPALELTHNRTRQVSRETAYLKLPRRIRDSLIEIICTAVADNQDSRYQSASVMLEKVRELRSQIPLHPINPDHTRSFTLNSLKSMLEGSLETHYSWAHELCDRQDLPLAGDTDFYYKPLTGSSFSHNTDFLRRLLPEEIFNCLMEKIDESEDKTAAVAGIMTCNYPKEWKTDLIRIFKKYAAPRLLDTCTTLLNNKAGFFVNREILFEIIGNEGQRLKDCYYAMGEKIRNAPHIGLALFALYALLGSDGFAMLLPSPSDTEPLFFRR